MKPLQLYCTCGASWSGYVDSRAARQIKATWENMHKGPGHAPCDARTARRSRLVEEQKQAWRRIQEGHGL